VCPRVILIFASISSLSMEEAAVRVTCASAVIAVFEFLRRGGNSRDIVRASDVIGARHRPITSSCTRLCDFRHTRPDSFLRSLQPSQLIEETDVRSTGSLATLIKTGRGSSNVFAGRYGFDVEAT